MIPVVTCEIPGLRIRNPLNGSTGHSRLAGILRSKERARERSIVSTALLVWQLRLRGSVEFELPIVVTLTRMCVRPFDSDGLAAGFKATRDAVADWLGVDDGDPRIEWRYAQERAKGYAVRIEITSREVDT